LDTLFTTDTSMTTTTDTSSSSSRLMLITGDYRDPAMERIRRPYRNGGDDDIQGDLLAPDLQRALQNNPACSRFLAVQQ
jgi:hypothetical protein